MKKILGLFLALLLLIPTGMTALAAEGKVTYDGVAKEFIFEPGSEHSPTNLFPDFKDVMPGDTLTQKITVKNDVDQGVKVKIYLRSLGAHEDSKKFLSKLKLRVKKSDDNEMGYMFDAVASETAQLTDWVCLGTLYSGGVVNLDVELEVPVELDNQFKKLVGKLDWEFMIEEFPVEEDDPDAPQTGDRTNLVLYSVLSVGSLTAIIILILFMRKKKENPDRATN